MERPKLTLVSKMQQSSQDLYQIQGLHSGSLVTDMYC